ncbi:MAG: hypothetical protein PW788_03300 [Micavibrio sp.]|nr:hypothetical protein [Micavibrio sp.]
MQSACSTTSSALPAAIKAAIDAYPDWINRTQSRRADLSFQAAPLGFALFDALTLAVDVRCGENLAATYRLNIDYYAARVAAGCLVLSPLLVKWADNGTHRKPGHDEIITAHCVDCLRGLHGDKRMAGCNMLLTTGYLTVQRGGMAFFAGLGWKSASFSTERILRDKQQGLLRKVARRIDDISRADRTLPEELSTIRFAYRHISARTIPATQNG